MLERNKEIKPIKLVLPTHPEASISLEDIIYLDRRTRPVIWNGWFYELGDISRHYMGGNRVTTVWPEQFDPRSEVVKQGKLFTVKTPRISVKNN